MVGVRICYVNKKRQHKKRQSSWFHRAHRGYLMIQRQKKMVNQWCFESKHEYFRETVLPCWKKVSSSLCICAGRLFIEDVCFPSMTFYTVSLSLWPLPGLDEPYQPYQPSHRLAGHFATFLIIPLKDKMIRTNRGQSKHTSIDLPSWLWMRHVIPGFLWTGRCYYLSCHKGRVKLSFG